MLRTSASQRQARYRERQRDGVAVVTIGLTPDQTAKLHRLGLIALDKLEDRAALVVALHTLIDIIEET
jgi:hypothetical protein